MALTRGLAVPYALLAWLGGRATWCLAAGIFLGVGLPPLAEAVRPLLTPAIFLLIVVTVVRLEPAALRASLARPARIAFAVCWLLVGAPLLVVPFAWAAGGDGFLVDHVILTAASAPVISAAAYALLLGLDAAFALTVGVIATALVPFTLPLLVALVLDVELALSPWALLARLLVMIAGGAALGLLVRRWLGPSRLESSARAVDGLAVLAMLVFGLAVMDGVTMTARTDPAFVASTLAVVFALAVGLNLAGTVLFARGGWRLAMTVGLMSGFKNFGVVVAAMGAAASPETVVYLGLAQFPIYVLPVILRVVARRRRTLAETRS